MTRVFELRQEVLLFFKENNKASFCECLESTNWQMKLAYLADIYQDLNNLNTSMQSTEKNILTSTDKLLAFKNKFAVWNKSTFQEETLKCSHSCLKLRLNMKMLFH